MADQRARQRDTLALAAGESRRAGDRGLAELEQAGRPPRSGARRSAARHAPHAQRKLDVAAHGHVRIERVALEHHRDVALLRREPIDPPLADVDLAGRQLSRPAIRRSSVDLPQPDGPRMVTSSPSATSSEKSRERDDVAEVLAESIEDSPRHQRPLPARTPERSAGSSTKTITTAGMSMITATALDRPGKPKAHEVVEQRRQRPVRHLEKQCVGELVPGHQEDQQRRGRERRADERQGHAQEHGDGRAHRRGAPPPRARRARREMLRAG